ncbi:MAG: DUF4126 domain-containing protein [Candidatus Pacebacteria bacterium]|nr:DUF4126 domain-containing protein [Candidatus Paceibacterota bacterium]
METLQLLGSTIGLAFFAGIRLYATVLTIGLGIHFGWIDLPPNLSALAILSNPTVLITAGVIYLIEFFTDKIPWVDSLWDSIHTFIRPLGAAVIGLTAFSSLAPELQIAVFLLCGGIGLSSHSTKAGIRLVLNHSPEPVSNIFASFLEEIFVIGGTWIAVNNPIFIFVIVITFLIIFAFLFPKIFRLMRVEIHAFVALFRKYFKRKEVPGDIGFFDVIPDKYKEYLTLPNNAGSNDFCVRCISGKGSKAGKNYIGYLCLSDNHLFFLTRKRFRIKKFDVDLSGIEGIRFERKFLLDRIIFVYGKKKAFMYFFRDWHNRGLLIVEKLNAMRGRIKDSQKISNEVTR